MTEKLHRRSWLTTAGIGLAATTLPASAAADRDPFLYCFNTSTIMGQNRPLVEEFEITAKAGYSAIEPWIREIDQYTKQGGSLKDLRKRANDLGLKIIDAIGFVEWIVDDDDRRRKGLEEAKRVMGVLQELECPHLAAPPVGATNQPNLNLLKAAERYHALATLGQSMSVVPMVEHWGHSQAVRRLGEAAQIAMESQHPKACVLPDVFHMYKGGSDFEGIRLLGRTAFPILHVNDYPKVAERSTIRDDQRVFPGDGIAPLQELFSGLKQAGWQGYLSLELFNKEYYKRDPGQVAAEGLAKLKAVVSGTKSAS